MKEKMNAQKIGSVRRSMEKNRYIVEDMGHKESSQHDIYDSPTASFGKTFEKSLPEEYIQEELSIEKAGEFKNYIEETLSKGEQHNLTAVEFGGPGSKLFSGFTSNFFKRTVGVCLKDIRTQNKKTEDRENNHSVVEGDILTNINILLAKVTKELKVKKVDLIISRIMGPLNYIDMHPIMLDHIIRKWYGILQKNGLMFIQFELKKEETDELDLEIIGESYSVTIERIILEWITAIKDRCPQIDLQASVEKKGKYNDINSGVLRLHKKNNAPDELPTAYQLFNTNQA